MNEIILPIPELKTALVGLGKVINRSSAHAILTAVKVERTKDGWITLTGSDADKFVTVRLEEPTDGEPAATVVPIESLKDMVKLCAKERSISLKWSKEESVVIEYRIGSQVAQRQVEAFPVVQYPEIPRIKGDAIPINDGLRKSMLEALDCASDDETRYVLNGVYIDVSQATGNYVVGCDGRHLYSANSFTLPLRQSLIIPDNKFVGWKEFTADGEWQLRVNDSSDMLQLSSRKWRYISRVIEGQYPNWQQVVPDQNRFMTTLTVNEELIPELLITIERMPCYDSKNLPIGLKFDGKKVFLLGRTSLEEGPTEVPIEGITGKGKPVTIYLNRELLSKALEFDLTSIEIIDPASPLRFSRNGKQMIVLPLRLPDATQEQAAPQPQQSEPEAPTGQAQAIKSEPQPMVTNNTEETTEPKSALEIAMEQAESLKESAKSTWQAANTLILALKAAQKEQRSAEKEVQSVRSTLRTLQSVRI